jgi:hypothetical protein
MYTSVIGIDPGISGGISIFHLGKEPKAFKMPPTHRDIADLVLGLFLEANKRAMTYLEQVNVLPHDGTRSAKTFMVNYGALQGILSAYRMPYKLVSPAKWQRAMQLKPQGERTKTIKKNEHKAAAQRLFPEIRMTHALADALLIGQYGMIIESKVN